MHSIHTKVHHPVQRARYLGRTVAVATVALIVSAASVLAADGAATTSPSSRPSKVPIHAGEQTAAALTKTVWTFEAKGERLDAVLRRIGNAAGVAFDVRWEALSDVKITPDMPITVSVKRTEASRVLAAVVDATRDAGRVVNPAAWPVTDVLDGGTILMTTRRDLFANFASERRYPLGELIDASVPPGEQRDVLFNNIKVIVEDADPKTWQTRPGSVGGAMRLEGDVLVVTQSDGNHRRISGLLGAVRAEQRRVAAAKAAAAQAKAQPHAGEYFFAQEAPAAATQPSAIRVALNARVGQLRPAGRSFSDVVDELRDNTGQGIFVNWRALESIRVTRKLPVTTDLSSLTLAEALDKLLQEVGGTHERLGYTVDDDVVTISTLKDLGRNTLTRVYDVRDLLKDPATRAEDLAALLKRFQGIDPLSWRDAGGNIGAIRELQGQLIITQSPDVHARIVHELEELLPGQPRPQFPMLDSRPAPAKK
jgi:hypothetical protein